MTRLSLIALLAWLSVCFVVATLAAMVTDPGEWYAQLDKPAWTPPDWLFAPAWTVLYTLMGVSAWMIWERRLQEPLAWPALLLFLGQLVLNGLWSWFFFGQHAIVAAFVDILLLWTALLATLLLFLRVRRPAGLLLVPYLLWVTYAVALNGAIVVLNA
ncbi:tryptophan-rich sensory protein [Aquisalimonas sp. 2447]|uniref:TspO/MBR family protein n=1 Tax=Aquisalimonas sp. 2447 TaxID=2740807 RepID=UPI0014326F7A|nr:TspO/MBR family protein [Aquisalimonas sp. 2447]QIT56693.1 tryptophan-rich sensory protein [Aquisalimonas sp. 2447]